MNAQNQNAKFTASLPKTTREVMEAAQAYILAGNPKTARQTLQKLAKHLCVNVRRRIAENVHTPMRTLSILSLDVEDEVRLAVADNASAPVELLERLSNDCSVDVRYGLAENANVPVGILERLAADENPYVAARALRTLVSCSAATAPQRSAKLFTLPRVGMRVQNYRNKF